MKMEPEEVIYDELIEYDEEVLGSVGPAVPGEAVAAAESLHFEKEGDEADIGSKEVATSGETRERPVVVTLDTVSYSAKPEGSEAAKISKRLAQPVSVELTELKKHIESGCTFCPGVFDGKRSNEMFKQAEILVLDFDDTVSIGQVLDASNRYELPPFMGYYSFSHTEEQPRFRMGWRLDKPVGDTRTYDVAIRALLGTFKQADSQCKDPARMFYGTDKEFFHYDPQAVVSLERVVDAFCVHTYYEDGHNAARTVKTYAKKCSLPLTKSGLPHLRFRKPVGTQETKADGQCAGIAQDAVANIHLVGDEYASKMMNQLENEESTASSILYIIEDAANSSKTGGFENIKLMHTAPADAIEEQTGCRPRNIDFDLLAERCQSFGELIAGKPLDHGVTFGIATTLLNLVGGETKLREGLRNRDEWSDPRYEAKWTYQIRKIKDRGYQPKACDNFCPYISECHHDKNPLYQLPVRRGQFRRLRDIQPPISLLEAEKQFSRAFQQAIERSGDQVSVLKTPCGLGKTEAYLGLKDCILSLPTHALCAEVAERMAKNGNKAIVVPNLDDGLDPDLAQRLDRLHSLGAHSKANEAIWHEAEKAQQILESDRTGSEQRLVDYKNALDCAKEGDAPLLVTHKRLLRLAQTPHSRIICDEDPLDTWMEIGSVSHADLSLLRELATEHCGSVVYEMDAVLNAVYDVGCNTVRCVPANKLKHCHDLVELVVKHADRFKDDVLGLFGSDFFANTIADDGSIRANFARRPVFPDKRLIVLSATADQHVYESAVGGRGCDFWELPPVEHTGRILQYWLNYSRSALRKPGKLKAACECVEQYAPNAQVITYQCLSTCKELNTASGVYFGNLRGKDILKGKDVAVVGAHRRPPVTYALTAAALGMGYAIKDFSRQDHTPVRDNGYEFSLMTYRYCEGLRRAQLWLVGSEMVQAVGRARALRENCTVTVFSDYPVPQADIRRLPKDSPSKADADDATDSVLDEAA